MDRCRWRLAVDPGVGRPENDFSGLRVDQPPVLVAGLVRQRGGDLPEVKAAQMKHRASVVPGTGRGPRHDRTWASQIVGGALGLELAFEEASTIELSAGNGDKVQLFGQGHRYFDFCRHHNAKIVPLFEVDDLDEARAEIASSGSAANLSLTMSGRG